MVRLFFMALLAMGQVIANGQTADSVAMAVRDSVPMRRHVRHSHLEVGMTYQSNDVYLGRKSAATLPYFIPAVSYYHKSGLFASATVDYLKTSSVSRVDLFSFEAGYMFTAKKYDGTLTLTKYDYNNKSTNIQSGIQEAVAYENGYDLGFVKPRVTATIDFGDKVDVEGLFALEHTFMLFHDNLDITPTLALAGSTLHFYDYYRRRKYTTKKNKTGVAKVTGSVVDASRFRLMDYEPTIPIEYSIGKFTVNFSPTYAIPINPATIDVHTVKENGVATDRLRQEKVGNTFFFTCEVSVMF